MPSQRIASLTNQDIARTASGFQWTRQMPKWTVIVDGKEFPARPLVLEAAGVPPNDPTNSHQAVAILKERGFDVRYRGKALSDEKPQQTSTLDDLIAKLKGRYRGPHSLRDDRERDHRIEKGR